MTANDRVFAMGNGGSLPPRRDVHAAGFPDMSEDVLVEKWPVWLRLVVIIGLSASLWALIILGVVAIFR